LEFGEVRTMMFGPYSYGAGWGWMAGGWIIIVLFWGLLIFGIVALIRGMSPRSMPTQSSTPVEILKRRYAAGELTKDQFEEMKRNVA
jgi:putative membrane protein